MRELSTLCLRRFRVANKACLLPVCGEVEQASRIAREWVCGLRHATRQLYPKGRSARRRHAKLLLQPEQHVTEGQHEPYLRVQGLLCHLNRMVRNHRAIVTGLLTCTVGLA